MISSIYDTFTEKVPAHISAAIKQIIEKYVVAHKCSKIFFRADDIAVPSNNYTRMMDLFLYHKTALCLAVVPTWMTQERWGAMSEYVDACGQLLCWHLHGYQHKNYESDGKKQEFGPSRSSNQLFLDLNRGHQRLTDLLGEHFTPVFTPPWNRCSLKTMALIKQLGFWGVSRSYGAKPLPPEGVKDFVVHVDLHTRKDRTAQQGWQNILNEFEQGLQSEACGIMIHHTRMNDQSFIF